MPQCNLHGFFSGPFCSDCDEVDGPSSAKAAGYRLFNEDRKLGQNQYASRYVDGRHGHPNLGEGLRFMGDPSDYHSLYIHVDDYDTFRERVLQHRLANNG